MTRRPRVSYDESGPRADDVRLWLLQLGAEPVVCEEGATDGLPQAPQHVGVSRSDVATLVRALTGRPSRQEAFDDHGSVESWPRGSF